MTTLDFNLGIFGDSHAYQLPGAWTQLLENNFKTKNHALYGTSVWYSYKKFINTYKSYSHVVFVYTEPSRVHYLPDHLAHYSFLLTKNDYLTKVVPKEYRKELETVLNAIPIILDFDFDYFISQTIFNEVNRLCKEASIRLINVLPYENAEDDLSRQPIDLTNRSGPCVTGLRWVSDNEPGADYDLIDNRAAHISVNNNKILYKMILDLLNSTENDIIHLRNTEIFEL